MPVRYTDEELEEEIVFYCSRCLSLNIIKGKQIGDTDAHMLSCADCGAGPKHIDVTNLKRFWNLYRTRTGHHFLADPPSKYDDLRETYSQEAEIIITASEALSNGLRVSDVVNRKIDE